MRIHHTGICVKDVQVSLDFYTRVLGLKQEETVVLEATLSILWATGRP
jgi:catechol 2,3-dioxygenase-like lactoylglutathione lyase family enzyme